MKRSAGLLILLTGALLVWVNAGGDNARARRESVTPVEKGEGETNAAPKPAHLRRLDVLVIDVISRQPFAGAVVGVWRVSKDQPAVPAVTTDKRGRATLLGPRSGFCQPLLVHVPGTPRQEGINRHSYEYKPDATEVLLEVPAPRTIRWKILPGPFGIPPDGTRIPLAPPLDKFPMIPPRFGTMQNGVVVVPGWYPDTARARAIGPGGSIAMLRESWDDVGEPVAFQSARSVELRLGASGVRVGLAEQGFGLVAAGVTDAQGRVRFDLLPYDFANLVIIHGKQAREWIGRVDLRGGETRVAATPVALILLHVRLVGAHAGTKLERVTLRGLIEESMEFDAETGRLTGRVIPAVGEAEVWLEVETEDGGYARAQLALPGPQDVRLFGSSSRGTLRVVLRGKLPEGFHDVAVVRRTGERWEDIADIRPPQRVPKLDPGLYGVRTAGSRVLLGTVRVRPGETATIAMDGSRLELVSCLVTGPDGQRVDSASVEIIGAEFSGELGDIFFAVHFECLIPSGAHYRLRATHARFAPASFEGVGGREAIPLRLVRGPTARLSIPDRFLWLDDVYLYRGDPGPHAEFVLVARRDGERWMFSGYAPGVYTLCFAADSRTPLVLRNVKLGKEDIDLGAPRFPAGSALTIELRAESPFVAPPMRVSVLRLEPPHIGLGETTIIEGRIRISGLGAGRYSVKVKGGPIDTKRVVTLDGKTDRTLTLNLTR